MKNKNRNTNHREKRSSASGNTAGKQHKNNMKLKITAIVAALAVIIAALAAVLYFVNTSRAGEDYNKSREAYDARARKIAESMITESHAMETTLKDFEKGEAAQDTALAYLKKEKRNMEAYIEYTRDLKDSDYVQAIKSFGEDCLGAADDAQKYIEAKDEEAGKRARDILGKIADYQKTINARRSEYLEH